MGRSVWLVGRDDPGRRSSVGWLRQTSSVGGGYRLRAAWFFEEWRLLRWRLDFVCMLVSGVGPLTGVCSMGIVLVLGRGWERVD